MNFFSCQVLVFWGNHNDGSFKQLTTNAKFDPRITFWMEKKNEKIMIHKMKL